MASIIAPKVADESNIEPEIDQGLVEALTSAYSALLKRQRTASSAYVRWTAAHSRSHEFAWLEEPQEPLLLNGRSLRVKVGSPLFKSLQKMKTTIELNPYERELQYGYPYVIGQASGITYRAPLLTSPIEILTDGPDLLVQLADEQIRFNSLPFRSEHDAGSHELALTRLIETCPGLPISASSLASFCAAVSRDLGVVISAKLDGSLNRPPTQPFRETKLTIVDNAACFIAPKTSYFLVSDLEEIGRKGSPDVSGSSLAWLIGKRPSEATSDQFSDRRNLYYPFPSNQSQRRVAHLVADPKSRITVVQGPPGTGKSLTIANLVCHLVAIGKRVLVTSQKDKALDVVDDLLRKLDLPEMPMTLLRQDKDSKAALKARLESIQKAQSSEQAKDELATETDRHLKLIGSLENDQHNLIGSLLAEHSVETAEIKVKEAVGFLSRVSTKWALNKAIRRAERHSRVRSDTLGKCTHEKRQQLLQLSLSVLKSATNHKTCSSQKAERNQLRELAKILGRNQTNVKNFKIFDQLKSEPERCKMLLSVLPCWIMSPDDVARLFPCDAGLFDVVIVDEASQCDLPSMTPVLYRAKQAVVAGDSKQMQAQRFAFTSNQVASQAWAQNGLDKFDPKRWLDPAKIDLLQLASVRMDEEVFLNEHYRCLPDIISFSNDRWYNPKMRLMRDADDKRCGDPALPAIALYRTAGKVTPGTQENEEEAKALVSQLQKLLNDPSYTDATFGVICLFEEQMRLVSEMISDLIPEDILIPHELVVVNPDGFQGDERDVIFYSLSYDADKMGKDSLSARQSDREHIQGMLNVAFTRAREEMHIFHSAEISEFGMANGKGAIKDWLMHCAEASKIRPALPTDLEGLLSLAQSQFEQQVITALYESGISVRPQFPSCGFFIDVVAEFEGNRIAIECDGEIWHLDEHGELRTEDLARQEILERAGWNVVRVPYRSWRKDPSSELKRLLDALKGALEEEDEVVAFDVKSPSPEDTIAVEKHQWAILMALKSGHNSQKAVFQEACKHLGYGRLGSRIAESLRRAVDQLSKKRVISVEDNEIFFSDSKAKAQEYTISQTLTYESLFAQFRHSSSKVRKRRRN